MGDTISTRAVQRDLRDCLLNAGMTNAEIACEFARRYGMRRRAAFRHAHGWSLQQAAAHINSAAAHLGLDPDVRAPMSAPYLCELEHFPHIRQSRRLSPYLLVLFAAVYGTEVHRLLDPDDRRHLRPADRIVIDAIGRGRTTACPCGHCGQRPATTPPAPASPLGTLASAGTVAGP
jgi:hypothetical protein